MLLRDPSDGQSRLPRRDAPGDSQSTHQLQRRDSAHNQGLIIFTVIILSLLVLSLALYLYLRALRIRGKPPKYVPTSYFKRKWDAWTPGSEKYRSSSALQDRRSIQMARSRSPSANPSSRVQRGGYGQLNDVENGGGETSVTASGESAQGGDSNVNRNTSVRSIMTLPAYTPAARETEQIIGREGDRAGIDTVVEFPETAEEEEARREEEMGELYQIREARRVAAGVRRQEREARRAIREARSRGDDNAVRDLRRQQNANGGEAESRNASRNADQLIASHETNDRERERGRKISEVAYAALGVARHDGSRVRSHSTSSDNQPLLTSAASMGDIRNASRLRSDSSSTQLVPVRTRPHNRAFSSSSSLARVYTPDMSDDERSSGELEPPTYRDSESRSRSTSRVGQGASAESEQLTPPSGGTTSSEENRDQPPPPEYQESTALGIVATPSNTNDHEAPNTRDSHYEDAVQEQQQSSSGAQRRDLLPAAEVPPYESPQPNNGAPRLAPVTRLPSIQITPFSPVEGTSGREWGNSGSSPSQPSSDTS